MITKRFPTDEVAGAEADQQGRRLTARHPRHAPSTFKNTRSFFLAFKTLNLQNLSPDHVNTTLNLHSLTVLDLLNEYSEDPYQKV